MLGMRQFEVLLVFCDFLALLAIVFTPSPRLTWKGISFIFLMLASGMQLFSEGARWQLAPAYLLTFLLLAMYLPMGAQQLGNRNAKLFVGAVGGLTMVATVSLALIFPIFGFELPTGRYEIGTVTYHWVDDSRSEVFSTDAKARRELMVQIWYPTKKDTAFPQAPYVEDAEALGSAQAELHGWPGFVLGHLKYVKSNAKIGPPIAEDHPEFPVLIFLEGITGYRQMNTFQVEHLVSRGYIVVAIDQPFIAATVVFPDGRQIAGWSKNQMNPLIQQSITAVEPLPTLNGITFEAGIVPYFAQDVVFLLNQIDLLNKSDSVGFFKGRLDLNRMGIFGVSLGGIIVGEVCQIDRRLRACLVMDAPMTSTVVREGLRQPSMWISRDGQTMRNEGWALFDVDQHVRTMRRVFDKSSDDAYFIEVAGLFHANLTDIPHFSPLLQKAGITGPIDPKRAHKIINTLTAAFFDQYLEGPPSTILDGGGEHFPEVKLEIR
jgi:Platelet-activating factor acetylhydrolase, isoform II